MMDAVKFITEHPQKTRRCRRTRISTHKELSYDAAGICMGVL